MSNSKQKVKPSLAITQIPVGQLQANCYIVTDSKSDVLIVDPGDDAGYIAAKLAELKLKPSAIAATHGHFDHIMGVVELQFMYSIPFLINEKDIFLVKRMQETAKYFLDRDVVEPAPQVSKSLGKFVKLGSHRIQVIATPGHTPGSVCFYSHASGWMLTGDTIFKDAVGRTDFSYSSANDLSRSINSILAYPDNTKLYPGHGESTTVANEKRIHTMNM